MTCIASAKRNQSKRKCISASVGGNGGRCVETAGEQIDGIPDAAIEDQPVKHGQQSHGDPARQSALHSGGDGIDLQRKPGALDLLRDRQPLNFRCGATAGFCRRNDRNFDVVLVRKHLAKPANCADQIQNRSQNADRCIGQQAGKNQRDTKSHDERPRGWRGQYDRPRDSRRRVGLAFPLRLLKPLTEQRNTQL